MGSVIEIFFCYAREDEALRLGLEKQLRALKRQGLIDVWHDRKISAGEEWEREIDKHLNTAQIILLLISPDFIVSDYCYSVEMKKAMERHERDEARVIPIILRPVYWRGAPFGKLQALPKDAKPIIGSGWHDLDEAFFSVAEGIREAIEELIRKSATQNTYTQDTYRRGWEPEDSYRRGWNRQHRGLLILLLDQSESMQRLVQIGNEQYANGEMATLALNDTIVSVINNTPIDSQTGRLKDFCDLLVLGYDNQVTALLDDGRGSPVSIEVLADNPRGQRVVLVEKYDRAQGRNVQSRGIQPYWIDYHEGGEPTEITKALQRTYRVIQDWLLADPRRRQSFPPIVINITDGIYNSKDNFIEAAKRICQLYTDDGHVLLFSCHLSSNTTTHYVFPRTAQEIYKHILDAEERERAGHLFEMTSEIPGTMVKRARETFNVGIADGSRGFIYNANPSDLIDFLRWGTQPG